MSRKYPEEFKRDVVAVAPRAHHTLEEIAAKPPSPKALRLRLLGVEPRTCGGHPARSVGSVRS